MSFIAKKIKINQRGNIVVFALSAIAVMSMSASVFATTTFIELRKSKNVEQAVYANYSAESGVENALFLIDRSLAAGLTLEEISTDVLGISGYDAEDIKCGSADDNPNDWPIRFCDSLNITLGVKDLPVSFTTTTPTFTINMFSINDRDAVPYPGDSSYQIDRLQLSGVGNAEFEISFIVWDIANGVKLLPPIRRRVKGAGDVINFDFAGSICNNIIGQEQPICTLGKTKLGKVRFRLLTSNPVRGATLNFFNGGWGKSNKKNIPGFIEVNGTGRKVGNKQAFRTIQTISGGAAEGGTPGLKYVSTVWDNAIFSEKSLSK